RIRRGEEKHRARLPPPLHIPCVHPIRLHGRRLGAFLRLHAAALGALRAARHGRRNGPGAFGLVTRNADGAAWPAERPARRGVAYGADGTPARTEPTRAWSRHPAPTPARPRTDRLLGHGSASPVPRRSAPTPPSLFGPARPGGVSDDRPHFDLPARKVEC